MFPTTIIASYSDSSSQLFPDILANVHSRKLLLHTPLYRSTDTAASPGSSDSHPTESSLDTNVVMILSVLLCVLTCAIGVNSIIRCARSCSSRATESNDSPSAPLASTGVNKKALKMFPTITYSSELKLPGLDTDCVICLSEFAPGERVRVLPKCNHGFHIKCIDKWLMSHSSCPTCRHCLINTYKKIVNSSQTTLSELLPPPLQGGIVPVEPEDLIRNYRGIIC